MKKEKHILTKIEACKTRKDLTNFSHLLIDRNKFITYSKEIERKEKELIQELKLNSLALFETSEEVKASDEYGLFSSMIEDYGF